MKFKFLLFLFAIIICTSFIENTPTYKDATLSINERVDALIKEMTLEEKVVQLYCMWNDKRKLYDDNGWFSPEKAKELVPHGLGQIGRPSEQMTPLQNAKLTNSIQKFFVEETRLGIPVFFHEECLHGHAAANKTSFSQPIGLASTWNIELIEELFTMTAKEARAVGTHQALTPVVDVSREPRWGRVEETYGEDPYLVGQMGLAAVRGFQGRDEMVKGDHIMATLKHYAAHGQPESGTNAAPVQVSERTLKETFLYPFEVCVKEGNVRSIMASYNEIDGVPSHINKWLLETVLRDQWKFEGTVVSDYYALEELQRRHSVVEDYDEAGIKSLKAGVDVELPEPVCFVNLGKAVESGDLDIKYIDRALRRVLAQKFEMGLFENPYVDEDLVAQKVDTKENHQLALQAAEETMVLLKNQASILPLENYSGKTIAVIGPNADRVLLGGYSGEPSYFVTVLEGIQKAFGKDNEILFAQGCKITKDSLLHNGEMIQTGWAKDPVEKENREDNLKRIAEAKEIAAKADLIILCLGGNEQTSREAWVETHMGDRADLQLVGEQMELVRELEALQKPIVSLLFNGKPLAITELAEKSNALIECWYLGSETGNAIANVLKGEVNPSGKLPITFPRSVGHIPCFYNYKPTARRGYLFDDVSPLFAFGYGLSYSNFSMSNIKLSATEMKNTETVTLSVNLINNDPTRAGSEVVQLYIRDNVSSVTRPVKELKAFKKISLKGGEQTMVEFEISKKDLSFWTIDNVFDAEPGTFNLMVGNSSRDEDLQSIELTLKQ